MIVEFLSSKILNTLMEHRLQTVFLTISLILILSTVTLLGVEAVEEKVNVIVIPVDFPNLIIEESPKKYVEEIYNMFKDYWRKMSYGKLDVDLEVLDTWIRLTHPYRYYGVDIDDTDDNICVMVYEALKEVDRILDFSRYDYIMIMHSGWDQASTGNSEDIWSMTVRCGPIFTEEKIFTFISIVSRIDPVGIWLHEFGHLLGLPDLYDKNSREGSDVFVDIWDLMASGSWAGPLTKPGSKPTGLTSWSRIKLGWITSKEIFTVVEEKWSGKVVLKPSYSEEGIKVLKIPIENDIVYYLFEIREKVDFDSYLPSEGLIVLLVNESRKSGEGIVRVLPPPTRDLRRAAYSINEVFRDEKIGLEAWLEKKENNSYILGLRFGLKRHLLEISAVPFISVWINGTEMETDGNGLLSLKLLEGVYNITLRKEFSIDNKTKYVLEKWIDGGEEESRIIYLDKDVELSAIYSKMYFVNISSKIGVVKGDGWYREGEKVVIEMIVPEIVLENGTMLIFDAWEGDISSKNTREEFISNSPKSIEVSWRRLYKAEVDLAGLEKKVYWIEECGILDLDVKRYVGISEDTRLRIDGFQDKTSGKMVDRVVKVCSPLTLESVYTYEYKLTPVFLTIDGEVLEENPSQMIIVNMKNHDRSVWRGTPLWIEEGFWRVEEILWNGIDVSLKSMLELGKECLIPTSLKKIKVKIYDLSKKDIEDVTISLIIDNVKIHNVTMKTFFIYVPVNVPSTLLVTRDTITVKIHSPKIDLEITLPEIQIGIIRITLGQILLAFIILSLMIIIYKALSKEKTYYY